jgi:hypothetical protein
MTESPRTRLTYRLLDPDGETIGERDLPTDSTSLAWAEEVRGQGSGLPVLTEENLSAPQDVLGNVVERC